MELNGALWNPLEKGKETLARFYKLVHELRESETRPTNEPLSPRRERLGEAAEAIVRAADRPLRVAEVRAVLRSEGYEFEASAVRKALHSRTRGPRALLRRVGYGLYASEQSR